MMINTEHSVNDIQLCSDFIQSDLGLNDCVVKVFLIEGNTENLFALLPALLSLLSLFYDIFCAELYKSLNTTLFFFFC